MSKQEMIPEVQITIHQFLETTKTQKTLYAANYQSCTMPSARLGAFAIMQALPMFSTATSTVVINSNIHRCEYF